MDPDACLARLLDACNGGDRDTAVDALDDLRLWLTNGRFLPKDPRRIVAVEAALCAAEHLRVGAEALIKMAEIYERAVERSRE